VEIDETPIETAQRETLEETGLVVQINGLLDVFRQKQQGYAVTIAYAATITGGTLAPGDDAQAVRWFRRDELPPLVFLSTTTLVQQWREGTFSRSS
jgi:ADP-ribose pyrophosphatase YjhB (NUDIX family)